jgi:hypothetical protein
MIGADDDRNYEVACKVMRLLPIGPRGQLSVLIHTPAVRDRAAFTNQLAD